MMRRVGKNVQNGRDLHVPRYEARFRAEVVAEARLILAGEGSYGSILALAWDKGLTDRTIYRWLEKENSPAQIKKLIKAEKLAEYHKLVLGGMPHRAAYRKIGGQDTWQNRHLFDVAYDRWLNQLDALRQHQDEARG